MKKSNKLFIASLFENTDYITVYAEGKGDEIGRIYNENHGTRKKPVYIALLIGPGTKAKFDTLIKAKYFIEAGKKKCNFGQILIEEDKKPLYFQLWKKNERQRVYAGQFPTKEAAEREKGYIGYSQNYEFEICPVYENKQQKNLFA